MCHLEVPPWVGVSVKDILIELDLEYLLEVFEKEQVSEGEKVASKM